MFVTAAGAIGGLLAVGLLYHAVRCYLLRRHWREFAAAIIGDDGVQLADGDAMLQPGALRSDHDSIPIVDEELSVRLGLPPAPLDDEDADDDADDGGGGSGGDGDAVAEVGMPASVPAAELHPRSDAIKDAGLVALTLPEEEVFARGSEDNSIPLDGEDPASDPASTPSEEEHAAGPEAAPAAAALGPN